MVNKTLALIIGLLLVRQSTPPTDSDWVWLDEHRDRAFEALMPLASSRRQVVAYRRYRDLYYMVPEAHFTIGFVDGPVLGGPPALMATMTIATSQSIQEQLLQLHISDRVLSLEALLPRVFVARQTIGEERCPSIRSRLDGLSKVTIALPDLNIIALHPTVHRLVIDNGAVHIDASLVDSDDAVRWATDTLTALQACIAS